MGEVIQSASGIQYGMIVNPDGSVNVAGTVNANITGSIMIGSVSASVDSIYVQSGIINIQEEVPTSINKNNGIGSLIYAGALLGSIVKNIGGTEYCKVLTYSGTTNVIVRIGSWCEL